MEPIDVAVVGGGVVGLAVGRAAAERGHSVCVLERDTRFGLAASTHNSGVIHAGIYYLSDTLKAQLCVEGRERLYEHCRRYEVPHERCGKLIVARDLSEVPALEALAARGAANGVDDLELVDRAFIRRREPHVETAAALWSPSTGIIGAEDYVRTLVHLATQTGVTLLPSTPVTSGVVENGGIALRTPRETILARTVVNAAGLYADELSSAVGGDVFRIYPVRGDYAEVVGDARRLVNGPVYPLPDPSGHGLGVHVTRTTWGTVTLGPTARYQSEKDDYESNRFPLARFHESVRSFLPEIALEDLRPGGSGIRARAAAPGEAFVDFMIHHDTEVSGLIHAAGIDSPGLTASLAIGERVAGLVDEVLG